MALRAAADPVVALVPEKVHPQPGGRGLNSPGQHLADPPVCLYAVSRTLELSLQSSFQLSLTVLVLYRTRVSI